MKIKYYVTIIVQMVISQIQLFTYVLQNTTIFLRKKNE